MIKKVKKGLEGIEIGYFDTGQSFGKVSYYHYFDDPDKETRRYAMTYYYLTANNYIKRQR